jgi:hypothetical protein
MVQTQIHPTLLPNRKSGWVRPLIACSISCVLFGTALLALGADLLLGASQNLVFERCFIALGILAGAFMILSKYKAFLLVPVAYVLFILALPFIDFNPVKPAARAVREIQPGMTKEQVEAVIDRNFPPDGPFKRPVVADYEDGLMYTLDPDDGRYNAALIVVKFSGGKCVSAEFQPD